MRAIFEALGYYVTWDQESQAVFANNIYTDNFIVVDLKIDSICTYIFSEYDWDNKDFIKNHTKLLDHAPVIIDERTLVPVRAISEAGGCDVNWDNSTRSVYIKSTVPIVNNANNNLFNNSIYSSSSVFNKYASNPPKIVDDNGTFIAYLTTATTEMRGATYEQLMQFLNNNKQ